jgi:hypothetical protein
VTRSTPLALAFLTLTMVAASAQAQPADPQWEIGLSVGAGALAAGTYQHRYTPTLSNHPEATGAAGQDVKLNGETGTALAASVSRMLSSRLGVQLVLAATRSPLGGASGDYSWRLSYQGRQPPDYQPRPVEVSGSVPWPATDGELRQLVLGASLLTRFPLAARVSASLSGGVSVQRLEGDISPLPVTLFSEGGHSTLFSEIYRVRVAFEPVTTAGLQAGAEVAWQLSRRLSLALEARYFAARSTHLEPKYEAVLNNDEVIHQATPAELAERAPLQRVEVDPSFGSVWAGVRYRL